MTFFADYDLANLTDDVDLEALDKSVDADIEQKLEGDYTRYQNLHDIRKQERTAFLTAYAAQFNMIPYTEAVYETPVLNDILVRVKYHLPSSFVVTYNQNNHPIYSHYNVGFYFEGQNFPYTTLRFDDFGDLIVWMAGYYPLRDWKKVE